MLPKKLISAANEFISSMRAWEEDSEVTVTTGFMDQGPISIFAQMDQKNKFVVRAGATPVSRGLFGTKYEYNATVFDWIPEQTEFGQLLLETSNDNPKALWDTVSNCVFGEAIKRNR